MDLLYIVTTGGSFDEDHSDQSRQDVTVNHRLDHYFSRLYLSGTRPIVVPVLRARSTEMSDCDRELVLETTRNLLEEGSPIVITHDTDGMVEMGLFLKQHLQHVHVPIILTGAMTPFGCQGSDGLQNLTESLFAVRLLPAGLFIVIHNRVFPVDRVEKDNNLNEFLWRDPPTSARVQ